MAHNTPSQRKWPSAFIEQTILSLTSRITAAENALQVLQGTVSTSGGGSTSGGTTGSGGATGTTVLWDEKWLTSGSTWGPNYTPTGSASAAVTGAQGTITTSPSAYTVQSEFFTAMPSATDTQITTKVYFPTGLPEMYVQLVLNSDGIVNASGANNGYYVVLSPSANQVLLRRAVAGVISTLDTQAYTFTSGTGVNVQLIHYANGLQLYVWNVGASKPGTPLSQGADPSPFTSAGKATAYVVSGAVTTARTATFDEILVEVPSAKTITGTYTPTAGTSGGGSTGGGSTSGGGATNASGIQMPPTAPAGWSRKFSDDFTTDCLEGSFLATYPTWDAYPVGWHDTSGNGDYNPQYLSVVSSALKIHLKTVGGRPQVNAPVPRQVSGSTAWNSNLHARVSVCFTADTGLNGYKMAWLFWPDTYAWNDGEIDFPECGDLTGTIEAFNHQPGSPATNAFAANTGVLVTSGWHVATIEWKPSGVSFYLDGTLLGTSTGSSVPIVSMHYVLQTETDVGGGLPSSSVDGYVKCDWITIDSYVSG